MRNCMIGSYFSGTLYLIILPIMQVDNFLSVTEWEDGTLAVAGPFSI